MDLGAVHQTPTRMGILVRELGREDRVAVEDALTRCAAFNDEEIRVALELFDAGVLGEYTLLGAETQAGIKGYICLGRAALTQSTWYIYWICVHPSAQRTGLGHALQREAEAFVRSQDGQRLVLETSGRPDYARARSFYEKAGYTKVGHIPDFYRPGDDCVIYSKVLK